MDLNLVVLAGRIAAEPEMRTFESGATLLRLLVTVRTDEPRRRIDVVPVTLWRPAPDLVDSVGLGSAVWVAGSVQRRFWSSGPSRRSRLEVIAHDVTIRGDTGSGREQDAG